MNIRRAKPIDSGQIAEIYNFYIENTHHSFELEPIISEEMQERIAATSENYPFLVAEEAAEILAYAYAFFYKSRSAYKNSVEVSVYVKSNLKQKGIGTKLYERLFEELSTIDITGNKLFLYTL